MKKKALIFVLAVYLLSTLSSCFSRRSFGNTDRGSRYPHDSDTPKEPKHKKNKKN